MQSRHVLRNRWHAVGSAVAFLAGVSGGCLHAAELLDDGDFESSLGDGTFPSSGFWKAAGSGAGAGAICTTSAGRSGNGLWLYTASSTAAWWAGPYQQVTAVSGSSYRATAWVRTPADQSWTDQTRAFLHVTFLNSSSNVIASYDSPQLTAPNTSWQLLTVATEAAPTGTAYARFATLIYKPKGVAGAAAVNFDDCSLVSTSQPAIRLSARAVGIPLHLSSTTLSFKNTGNAPLPWTATEALPWLSINPASGTLAAGATGSLNLSINRVELAGTGTVQGALTVAGAGVSHPIDLYVRASAAPVPRQPAIVRPYGRLLRVQDRLPDGSLSAPYHYAIKGVAWSPSSMDTASSDVSARMPEFARWYVADTQLLRAMNANAVHTYISFGADTNGWRMLDYLYENGIKAIVTVDDCWGNTNTIKTLVTTYRNHPAILFWTVGNEWTINLYYSSYTNLLAAAQATERMAALIKSLDTNHPVATVIGDLDSSLSPSISTIVNTYCRSVDLWGLNVYRGTSFSNPNSLFNQWSAISRKPMFLAEYGADVFRTWKYTLASGSSTMLSSADGTAEESMQADLDRGLWREIANSLSAARLSGVCLGGCVFEWNDEWWKATGGPATRHDNLGFLFTPMPDGVANEEWFGLVAIDRSPRLAFSTFQQEFANLSLPTDLDQDGMPDSWEYQIVDANAADAITNIVTVLPNDDFDGDGVSNLCEYLGATDPVDPASFVRLTTSLVRDDAVAIAWQGGTEATQILESAEQLSLPDWYPCLTNTPPTPLTNCIEVNARDGVPARYYRLRISR